MTLGFSLLFVSTGPCLAQAPDSLGGRAVEVTIADGIYPFAEDGSYHWLTSVDTAMYAVAPVSGDVDPSYGTYSYTRTGASTARLSFADAVLESAGSVTLTFSSPNTGSMVGTLSDYPWAEQRGDFVLFSGPAPESIAGTSLDVTVTSGDFPYADWGSFAMTFDSTGTSYTIDAQSPWLLDSSGTCSYRKIGTSVGKLSMVDLVTGEETTSLSFRTATTGTYFVVTDDLSAYQTGIFEMTAPTAPFITQHPSAQSHQAGESAVFTVLAAGTEPFSYQWQKDGADLASGGRISGAQGCTLRVSGLVEADAGEYRVIVTNVAGSATSNPARLTVAPAPEPPSITSQPENKVAVEGSSVTFTVTATGTEPFTYQWHFNDEPIPEATSRSLDVPNVDAGDAGHYVVSVSNAAGSVISEPALLTVLLRPRILAEPQDVTALVGDDVVFEVVASGSEPLAYQWYADGSPLGGATGPSLRLQSVETTDAGAYWVVVTNVAGSASSRQAVLAVTEPPPPVIPAFTKIELPGQPARSTGVAWVDFDGDGALDVFLSQYDGTNWLYRNVGRGVLQQVTGGDIGADFATCLGGAWGDYDNDGQPDLFAPNLAEDRANQLYHNSGAGNFTRVSAPPFAAEMARSVTGAWADMDNDGNLDLFVANSAPGQVNFLYRNHGDGTFEKVTSGVPVTEVTISPCASWADFDTDGDIDLFVSSEAGPNRLYRNNGSGGFAKVTEGDVVQDVGHSFGCAWGDYDNDGALDLFVANFHDLDNFLYHNKGDGTFAKVTEGPVASDGGDSVGCAWGDCNNDGWLDLFVANESGQYNYLYLNAGRGRLQRVTAGELVTDGGNSRGCAWGDYDGDGDLDLLVGNLGDGQRNAVYRNAGGSNAWLKVRCVGLLSNRSGIGAKVRARATIAGRVTWQLREISGGTGYGSQDGLEAHFGLGDATSVELLRVEWPSGLVQVLRDVVVGQTLTVVEPPRLEVGRGMTPGGFELLLSGRGGYDYRIEASTNLKNWTTVDTLHAVDGTEPVVDRESAGLDYRFYRAVME